MRLGRALRPGGVDGRGWTPPGGAHVAWVGGLLLALLLTGMAMPPALAETPRWRVALAQALMPRVSSGPATKPRGLVLTTQRALRVPLDLPGGTRLWLASSPDGRLPLQADDLLRFSFVGAGGQTFRLAHDFRAPERSWTVPFGPVDLTGLLPTGAITATVELVDLQPSYYSTRPVYLVALAPGAPGAPRPGAGAPPVDGPAWWPVGLGLMLVAGVALRRLATSVFWSRARATAGAPIGEPTPPWADESPG